MPIEAMDRQLSKNGNVRRHQDMMRRYMELILIAPFYASDVGAEVGKIGHKNVEVPRTRRDLVNDIFTPLGPCNFRKSYWMDKKTFYRLHDILKPLLDSHFFPKGGGKRTVGKTLYLINTKMRLSMALGFFAGGSPLDIMVTHGVSFASVFTSVWGVVDSVNKCQQLRFNFPSHAEQEEISDGF